MSIVNSLLNSAANDSHRIATSLFTLIHHLVQGERTHCIHYGILYHPRSLSLERNKSLLCVVIHRALQESLISGFQSGSVTTSSEGATAVAVGTQDPPRVASSANTTNDDGTDELDSIPDYLDPNLELAIKLSQEEERRREEERKREEEMLAEVLRLSLEDK